MNTKNVYLAGPDVFYPNAQQVGKKKCEELKKHNIKGLYPIDAENLCDNNPKDIFLENCKLIDKSEAVLANIEAFRGPSLDAGTAWEIGYAYAKKIPIILYGANGSYIERCRALKIEGNKKGFDKDNNLIEDLGEADNPMVTQAAKSICKTFEEAIIEIKKILNLKTTPTKKNYEREKIKEIF